MNCKPGDLAVIVRPFRRPENVGHLVTVIQDTDTPGVWLVMSGRPLITKKGFLRKEGFMADACLRPIRDNDREDETLAWAGRPRGVAEHV